MAAHNDCPVCLEDCPICMEVLSGTKNIVTTECGHCFHTNCLMTSVAHNGFGCPYCRTQMAETPDGDESDDGSEWTFDEGEEEELYGNHSLRGFRWLFQRVNGEELEEEEDLLDEDEEREDTDIIVKPSAAFIAEKLVSQGITMENMVRALLVAHEEYDNYPGPDMDGILFGKLRVLISNYKPEDDKSNVDIARVDSFYENRFMRVE